jgi:hypothetical protein
MLNQEWLRNRPGLSRRPAARLALGLPITLWLLAAPTSWCLPGVSDEKVPCDITAEDRAVYAVVLKDPDVWRLPVSAASTAAFTLSARKGEWNRPKRPLGPSGESLRRQAGSETRDDFAAKSTKSCYLGAFSQKDLERGADGEARTDRDERRPPKTIYWAGTIALSRVGFNSAKDEALVYTESDCGPGCGGGDFFLLRKAGGVWAIVAQINLWEL